MMNMKHLAIILAAMTMAASCTFVVNSKIVRGNGVEAEKTVEVSDFSAVSVAGSMDVIYSKTPQVAPVVIHGDENLLDYYTVEVKNGTLCISTEKQVNISTKADSYITVGSTSLIAATLTGSGDLDIDGDIETPGTFSINVTGSGNLESANIACKQLECVVAGSGDVDLDAVTAETMSMSVMGSGDISAGPVTAQNVSLSVAGSGDIDIELKDAGDITAKIAGSGDISLSGNASSLKSKVAGSGDVHSSGLKLGE